MFENSLDSGVSAGTLEGPVDGVG
ncbi:MAG: hypothetical protein QOK44_4261, partial [Betaproteobacteria bacterium]|nr:hypothetical protein [Betaproteobacteria bacterium]